MFELYAWSYRENEGDEIFILVSSTTGTVVVEKLHTDNDLYAAKREIL